jgi:hypothetical protein
MAWWKSVVRGRSQGTFRRRKPCSAPRIATSPKLSERDGCRDACDDGASAGAVLRPPRDTAQWFGGKCGKNQRRGVVYFASFLRAVLGIGGSGSFRTHHR